MDKTVPAKSAGIGAPQRGSPNASRRLPLRLEGAGKAGEGDGRLKVGRTTVNQGKVGRDFPQEGVSDTLKASIRTQAPVLYWRNRLSALERLSGVQNEGSTVEHVSAFDPMGSD